MSNKNENNKNHLNHNEQSDNKPRIRFRTLVVDGTRYRTHLNEKFRTRKKWDQQNKGKVYSEFPGTVVKVDVSEGDFVSKGDRLYIYEAMKMKNRAYSPVEGTVKELRIKENDIIRKGELLCVLE